MALLSLREAAEHVAKSKSTILRAIQSGRLSARKSDTGEYAIDPAELFRVYAPTRAAVAPHQSTQRCVGQDAPPDAPPVEVSVRMAELETEIRMLRLLLDEVKASRDDLRVERDDWRNRCERLLTDQRTDRNPPAPARRRPASPASPASPAAAPSAQTPVSQEISDGMAAIRRRLEERMAARGH